MDNLVFPNWKFNVDEQSKFPNLFYHKEIVGIITNNQSKIGKPNTEICLVFPQNLLSTLKNPTCG